MAGSILTSWRTFLLYPALTLAVYVIAIVVVVNHDPNHNGYAQASL